MRHRYDFDQLAEPASGSWWSKIFGGFVLAALLIYLGTEESITQEVTMRGARFTGTSAVLFGSAEVLIGCFCNVHYYWTVSEKLWKYSQLAKILLLSAIVLLILTCVGVAIHNAL